MHCIEPESEFQIGLLATALTAHQMDDSLNERDYMLLRIGQFGRPAHFLRLFKLLMGLDREDRARLLFDDKYFQSRVVAASLIFGLQECNIVKWAETISSVLPLMLFSSLTTIPRTSLRTTQAVKPVSHESRKSVGHDSDEFESDLQQ